MIPRPVRIGGNFVVGIFMFIAGGWLGQWTFTWNVLKVAYDILRSVEFRAVPAYSVGSYGLSWHTAYFVQCGVSTCVGVFPWEYVVSSDIVFLAVGIVELVWFIRLVRSAVR